MKNYYHHPRGFVFEVPMGLPLNYDFSEMYILRPGDADCLSTTPLLRHPDHPSSFMPWGQGDFYCLGDSDNSNALKFFRV